MVGRAVSQTLLEAKLRIAHRKSPNRHSCPPFECCSPNSITPSVLQTLQTEANQGRRTQMRLTGRATVVGMRSITRTPSIAEDGGVRKTRDTSDGRVGAVVVDVGPEQHQALQHAERKARTYGKALFGLASLLCLSVCGNLVLSSALSILVLKESRFSGAISPSVVPSDSKAAAPVGTSLTSYAGTGLKGVIVTPPFETPTYVKDTPADPEPPVVATAPADDSVPLVVSLASVPGMKRCAIAPSGTEACWELADPAMTDIPDNFLTGNTDLTGTLKVGPAVKTIGARAFAYSKITGLDLSEATSLVEIGYLAFFATKLEGTLVVPATVSTISASAFAVTKLTGTLKVGPAVKTI
eukprot:scaffold231_cov50-Phaeocystis_antarctica.AAC.2